MGFMGCKCLPWSIPSPCTILNQIFRKSGLLCMQAAIPPALRRRAVPRFFFTTHIYVFESYKTIFTWIYGSKNQTRILTFLGRPAPPSFKPFHFWRNTRDFEIPGKLWIHGHVNIYIYIQATEFKLISRIRVLHMWFYFPRKPKQQCNPIIHVELHEKNMQANSTSNKIHLQKLYTTNKPTKCVDKTLSVEFATLKTWVKHLQTTFVQQSIYHHTQVSLACL